MASEIIESAAGQINEAGRATMMAVSDFCSELHHLHLGY